jgi:hypothetical protein
MKKWTNKVNRAFSKGKVQMAKKPMKKCSTFLPIKEMQIISKLGFHITPIEHKQQQILVRMWGKSNLPTLLVRM